MISGVVWASNLAVPLRSQAGVERFHSCRHAGPTAVFPDIALASLTHVMSERRGLHQLFDRNSQLCPIARDYEAASGFPHDVGCTDILGDDHRQTALHGLDRRIAVAL